jgi:hypothetical protein
MLNVQVIVRELINEMLTPEEEREWHTHMASLPKSELLESREHFEAARAITLAMVRLMDQGVDPAAAEVQRLLRRCNETALKYHFRERLISRDRWNSTVARKVHGLGHRLIAKTSASESGRSEREILDFCLAARDASEWGKALDELVHEANGLAARRECPEAPSVQALASRFATLCQHHALGDPIVYARWAAEFGERRPGETGAHLADDGNREAWELLIDGVAVTRRSMN